MKRHHIASKAAIGLAALAFHVSSYAINGAELGGRGVQNTSMGGASIAYPIDALAAANNPAGILDVPDSAVIDMQYFRGKSSAQFIAPGNTLNNLQTIPVPEFGVVKHLTPTLAWDIALEAGGAGSDYGRPSLPVPGAANAKSSLKIGDLLPTIAWRPVPNLNLGASLDIGYEALNVSGVIVPAPVPGGLAPVPSHGTQTAEGVGVRVGALWHVTPTFSVGATYKSRTAMSRLAGYSDDILAYSNGHLDLAPEYGVGIAWVHGPVAFAADWLRINWGEISAMQDPNGFHWRNQNVYRAGVSWDLNPTWTLRAGYSHSDLLFRSAYTAQNLLVPSIGQNAYSIGAAWHVDPKSDVLLGYEFDPQSTLVGTGASTGTNLTSRVQMFLLGYQYKF